MSRFYFVLLLLILPGCGLVTPEKNPFTSQVPDPDAGVTDQGLYESKIVDHITCEIAEGLRATAKLNLKWISEWGTTVTQTITVEDQSGVSPGISSIDVLHNSLTKFPNGNVTLPQTASLNYGVTGSVNALRTETIQYTFANRDILDYAQESCNGMRTGLLIEGDLKIRQFVLDKATIAAAGPAALRGDATASPFNTFTEEITFVAAYGGTFTPTWKLARFTANASTNLLVAERTNTNDLVITLGPLLCPDNRSSPPKGQPDPCKGSEKRPVELIQAAMTQHNARVQASAIAVSIANQSH